MALNDLDVKRAKPKAKPYRLTDAGGLFLWVTKNGRYWRLRHRKDGKAQTASLGAYPEVSLLDARVAADSAKKSAKVPAMPTPEALSMPTFEEVAREWHAIQSPRWAVRHARKTIESLEASAFPSFGSKPITSVTPPVVLRMIREIEARAAPEHARKVRQRVSAVFIYAISSGLAESDPAAVIRGALAPRGEDGSQQSSTSAKPVPH